MPRWPAPQVDAPNDQVKSTTDQAMAAIQKLTPTQYLPPPPEPEKPRYDYRELNQSDADTKTYPYNGETVFVSRDPDKPGFAARWRATRRRQGWKWVKSGAWVTPLLNTSLPYEPLFWRRFSNSEHS